MVKAYLMTKISRSGDTSSIGILGTRPTLEMAQQEITRQGKLELTEWVNYSGHYINTWFMPIRNDPWISGLMIQELELPDAIKGHWEKLGLFDKK